MKDWNVVVTAQRSEGSAPGTVLGTDPATGHEIVARATDVPSGTPVVVSQTIRFQPDGYFRAVGVVRAPDRDAMLPRFRKVVDSVGF